MRFLSALPILVLLQAAPALAAPCGSVTFEGECMGTTLRYCSDGELVEIDCLAEYTANSVCLELDPVYGFGCAVAVGEACYFEDADEEIYVAACQGTNPGCLENESSAVCVENIGPCTESQVDTCTPEGGLIMLCPEYKQPNILDCMSLGGVCVPGRCEQVPLGGYCDDVYAFCATGLVCGDSGCEMSTMPPTSNDAGMSDRGVRDVNTPVRPDVGFGFPSDAGVTATKNPAPRPKDSSSCSCSVSKHQAHGMDSLSLLLLIGCVLLRRRSGAVFLK